MDPETGSGIKPLTNGHAMWRARCDESRTSGSEGGPRETTGRKTRNALAGLPYKAAHPTRLHITTRAPTDGRYVYRLHPPGDATASTPGRPPPRLQAA